LKNAALWFVAVCLLIVVLGSATCTKVDTSPSARSTSSVDVPRVVATPPPSCTPQKIIIKSMRARFVDPCGTRSCTQMKGVAVLTNTCNEPIGVQVKIVGLDKSGAPVASRDLWPASVSNIPPGDYTFSLDHYLDYDPAMKTFTLEPIRVTRW
jgi:hypothetical protein